MCKANKYITELTGIMSEIESDFTQLKESVNKHDKIEQDILHKIENGSFNACDGYKLALAIKNNRNSRREIKNEFETMSQLHSMTKSHLKKLNNTKSMIVGMEKRLSNSSYNPRVLKSQDDFNELIHN